MQLDSFPAGTRFISLYALAASFNGGMTLVLDGMYWLPTATC